MCTKISSQKFGDRLVIVLEGLDNSVRAKVEKMLSELAVSGDVGYEAVPENKMLKAPAPETNKEDLSGYLSDMNGFRNSVQQLFSTDWLYGLRAAIWKYANGGHNDNEKKVIKDVATDYATRICKRLNNEPALIQPVSLFLVQAGIQTEQEAGSVKTGIMNMMSKYFN